MEHMAVLSREDLLREAGIENILYQHRIIEALDARMYDSDVETRIGAESASPIKVQLCGLLVFCTSEKSIGSSGLLVRNVKMIEDTKHFILVVLIPGALECCKPVGYLR